VIALVPLSLAYAYRISIEERALVQTLGEPYTDYMKRTYRLIPFVL
jgi:protein-S-isoprenylcysteine O-methyltransferase Ste14